MYAEAMMFREQCEYVHGSDDVQGAVYVCGNVPEIVVFLFATSCFRLHNGYLWVGHVEQPKFAQLVNLNVKYKWCLKLCKTMSVVCLNQVKLIYLCKGEVYFKQT